MRYLMLLAFGAVVFAQPAATAHKDHMARDYKPTPMPPPHKLSGIGNSHLQITTTSPGAQMWFDQGFNLLHCFWDFEAYRAFKEAVRIDPDAAMAWWGIVQALDGYEAMHEESQAAADKADALLPKVSDHEQLYIRAQQKRLQKDGHDAYVHTMEELVDKYPADLDAKLFLALAVPYGYDKDGLPGKGSIYSRMLLDEVLRDHPDSAAGHHYRIHVLESSLHPADAVADADALSKLAPGSGHMIHMPGHIYFRIGEYDRARESFQAARRFEEDYMKRENVSTVDNWNYPHNLSYLIASDGESGRFKEALETANLLDSLHANPFLGKGSPFHAMTVGGAAVRLKMRFGDYKAAVDDPIRLGYEDADAGDAAVAFREGMLDYARGMQAIADKKLDDASHLSDAMDALAWRAHDSKAEDLSRALLLLDTASLDLRGNLLVAQGRFDDGIEVLKKAAGKEHEVGYTEPPQIGRPELEALGYAYIAAKKFGDARDAFTRELKLRPMSGHELYGIAQAWEAEGNRTEAAKAYREFLKSWANADADLPMVAHARRFVN
jgi:tetratricopeptide (TPR) repeat protein